MDNLVDKLIGFFYPKRCLECSEVGKYLCARCLDLIATPEAQICPQCTRPSIGGFTHDLCARPLAAERSICLFKFEGPIKKAIHELKYRGVRDLSNFLTDLAVASLSDLNFNFGREAKIVPVPIHPLRSLERGFNQSELLATSLGAKFDLEVLSQIVLKVKDNPSQTGLNLEQRTDNVLGVYQVDQNHRRLLRGKDAIVVDDVFTSGATLREMAKIVKRAGARFVYLLAIAKD